MSLYFSPDKNLAYADLKKKAKERREDRRKDADVQYRLSKKPPPQLRRDSMHKAIPRPSIPKTPKTPAQAAKE